MSSHKNASTGRSKNGWIFLLFATILMLSVVNGFTYREPITLTDEDFAGLFGPDGCIEGSLVSIPLAPEAPVKDDTITTCDAQSEKCSTENNISMEQEVNLESEEWLNFKEKTPMCLVNELARHNQITHQYRLTGEHGPPHLKKFMVTLKLGEEEYSADGLSIKKAQHAAATVALKSTSYKRPPVKPSKQPRSIRGNVTPTVQLNALAMRLGEPTTYTILEPVPNFNYYHRGMYTQPYHSNYIKPNYPVRMNSKNYYQKKNYQVFKVNVKVGDKEFVGEGPTSQAARHAAASKALEQLKDVPIEDGEKTASNVTDEIDNDALAELKSPVSLVHEIALKRNLNVTFDVVNEEGPPHMKKFVTICKVGDKFETVGEGNGKKASKKTAAKKMLEVLRSSLPAVNSDKKYPYFKRQKNSVKRKSKNLIKEVDRNVKEPKDKIDKEPSSDEINPISRLIQIQHAKREKEPVYVLVEEKKIGKRKEFSIEVSVGEDSFIGKGPNKRAAKKAAAEGLLQVMGYSRPTSNTVKQVSKKKENHGNSNAGTQGVQVVPGVYIVNKMAKNGKCKPEEESNIKISKDFTSNEGNALQNARPKEKLMYLSQALGFKAQFSDFPKGNHEEFLTLVTLSTQPPIICHGKGINTDISKDQAAFKAMKALTKMGFSDKEIISHKTKEESISQDKNQILSGNVVKNNDLGKESFASRAPDKNK